MGITVWHNGAPREGLYQDLWIKGAGMEVGGRPCKERYQAIEAYVTKLNRPLRVLDIGANMGYFTFRLAERFFGSFMMVECGHSTVPRLFKLCQSNENPEITLFAYPINLKSLEDLLKREQFDLVLALSVIHHFDEPFNDIVRVMTDNASHVILEHAHPDEEHCPNARRLAAEQLDLSPYSPEKLISTPATGYRSIFRDVWALKGKVYEEKRQEGLQLSTYTAFNGLYPHPEQVKQMAKKFKPNEQESLRLVKGRLKKA